jgi:hypothetical protein
MDDACKLKKELIMFKVDFQKAYDLVDWRYLEEVMGKMKFMFVCVSGLWNFLIQCRFLSMGV